MLRNRGGFVHRLLALLLLTAAAAARAERPPLQSDIDRCTLRAETSERGTLAGRVRFQLLVRPSGRVYAGYVHAEQGVDDRKLERCVLYAAMLWELSPSKLDYAWPYPISFVSGGESANGPGRASAFLPSARAAAAWEPIDLAAAQATLEISEAATPVEHALAELAVRRYPEAISLFRAALKDSADPVALRGLAQALAESGQTAEARTLAERLVVQAPLSEASHEALLRACLAAGDDACAFDEFNRANGSADLSLRWLVLRDDLLAPSRLAAARLRSAAKQRETCGSDPGAEQQALCLVRRCLEDGVEQFARDLGVENRTPYELSPWRVRSVAAGAVVVSRAIEPRESGPDYEPLWLVKTAGDRMSIRASNEDAREISRAHNRCANVASAD